MTGEVTFVSADLKVNNGGSAYYVVETSVNEEELCNRVGDEVVLKVGMLCETKVVIEEKGVLIGALVAWVIDGTIEGTTGNSVSGWIAEGVEWAQDKIEGVLTGN